jgi:molybdopterin-guanine dinucleotide biosynthesis protein A
MGSPKAWLDFGGETMLARVVRRVSEAAAPVVVVAAPGQDVPPLPPDVTVLRDPVAHRGPLQGVAAGLAAIAPFADAAFVSSTDAPFLCPALIRRLVALRGEDHDAVVPSAGGRLHPLCALYGVAALPEVEALLAAGQLRVTALVGRVRTLVADEALLLAGEELAAADPRLLSLFNVNTPEAYAEALSLVQ